MRRILQPSVFFGLNFMAIALFTTACQPEFEDDICDDADDCFVDEQCVNERCVVDHDYDFDAGTEDDAEENAGEENECGGTEPLSDSPGDACGPCDLDAYECTDDGDLVCDGDTECPDYLLTLEATDVTATTATLHAELQAMVPGGDIDAIGFCVDTEEEPGLDDLDCQTLDETPSDVGPFELDVDELDVATEYFARAYLVGDDDFEEYGNEISFVTDSPAPQITTESTEEAVIISWDEVDGATGYNVLADGAIVEEIDDPGVTSFEDETAPAGTLGAPQDYSATDDRTDGVELTWSPAQSSDGAGVDYQVVTTYPETDSEPSDVVEGHRLGPDPTGYEVYIGDDSPGADDWTSLGSTSSYLDDDAPKAQITAGTITATKGDFESYVRLELSGADITDADSQSYRLRATYGDDDEFFGAESSQFSGTRAASSIQYQWYRSQSDQDSDFDAIDGATQTEHNDSDAPADGSTRYYHAEVSADGADAETTPSDSGYRLVDSGD